jgi:hypothetical protein
MTCRATERRAPRERATTTCPSAERSQAATSARSCHCLRSTTPTRTGTRASTRTRVLRCGATDIAKAALSATATATATASRLRSSSSATGRTTCPRTAADQCNRPGQQICGRSILQPSSYHTCTPRYPDNMFTIFSLAVLVAGLTPEPSLVLRVTRLADALLDLPAPHLHGEHARVARDGHHARVVAHAPRPCTRRRRTDRRPSSSPVSSA